VFVGGQACYYYEESYCSYMGRLHVSARIQEEEEEEPSLTAGEETHAVNVHQWKVM